MKKPKRETKTAMNYSDMIRFIEEKYDINTRSYAGHLHRQRYEKESGDKYPGKPGDGQWDNDNQEERYAFYARYDKWVKDNPEPKNTDFWIWFISGKEVYNGCYAIIYIAEYLEDEKTPAWVKEILQKVYNEFKDQMDNEYEMTVWISW